MDLMVIVLRGYMKKILIILFGICFVSGRNELSVGTVILSGENLIKLASKDNRLELKRKSDITSLKKKDDLSSEKRRHKRRRKVRPPKKGK